MIATPIDQREPPASEQHAASQSAAAASPGPWLEPAARQDAVRDCLFLGLVVLLSLALYVHRLGFYGDDWAFLGMYATTADQSFLGLFRSVYLPDYPPFHDDRMRPVQILYLTGLYWLFGLQPLGYHLVNAGMLVAMTVLFYLALRELGQPRLLTLTVPLMYALLPHYSTDRFWYVSFHGVFSLVGYFMSLYADLRVLRARRSRVWGWKVLSLTALLASVLTYEVALPLFLVNPLVVWLRARQVHGPARGWRLLRPDWGVVFGSNALTLTLAIVFKGLNLSHTGGAKLGGQDGYLQHVTGLVRHSLDVSFDDYGIRFPGVVWRIVDRYPDGAVLTVGAALGLIVFGYLYAAAGRQQAALGARGMWFGHGVAGLVVFGLGYAIFLTNYHVQFTTSGIGNRVAIAAAIGVAMSFVGGVGWACGFVPPGRLRRTAFSLLIAVLCAGSAVTVNTLASFWAAAYVEQRVILAGLRERVPALPAGAMLILDGTCPYAGPAMVFESSWDLAGALMVLYRDPTLRADVVASHLQVGEQGLSTLHYGWIERHYPYGEHLLIYHAGQRIVRQLSDAEAARRYFQTAAVSGIRDCPTGSPGLGVPVF
ncbi:MAG: hypothetical protein ACRDI2_07185 [Chloroflexota bacterium]